MNDNAVARDRRQFLIKSTSTLFVAGIAATSVPFLASWRPTQATKLSGLPARVDLTKIANGEGIKLLWRGLPIWVIRRDEKTIAQLDSLRDRLKDPDSNSSQQPAYARNALRARRADVVVLTAVCTHLQCIPELKHVGDPQLDANLEGGFVCPCHGSRFDTSGRVLNGSPAGENLPVPSYYFENDQTLVIGVDSAQA